MRRPRYDHSRVAQDFCRMGCNSTLLKGASAISSATREETMGQTPPGKKYVQGNRAQQGCLDSKSSRSRLVYTSTTVTIRAGTEEQVGKHFSSRPPELGRANSHSCGAGVSWAPQARQDPACHVQYPKLLRAGLAWEATRLRCDFSWPKKGVWSPLTTEPVCL